MSAVLHVRCPMDGCGVTVDSVIQTETWGSVIPGDHGCGNVTLHGTALQDHITESHSFEDFVRTLAAHHERTVEAGAAGLTHLREQYPDILK